mmetsp:Transcript_45882/g.73929  ORF Transcript_45882/g.73929 Transcript_45882/m.73929 type:complete len:170 (+) Transcript_45882:140-649(+)
MQNALWTTAKHCAFALPVALTFNDLVASTACIDGVSMQPAFNPPGGTYRDRVLLDKMCIRMGRYKRGDICLIKSPTHPDKVIVKRLIALEGDRVRTENQGVVPIPQGFCWIEGDNEENSIDSATSHGPVPLALVQGRVSHILWPPSRIGRVKRSFPKERVLLGYQHPWP